MTSPTAYLLERAWVDGAVRDDVLVEIEDGRFTSVTLDAGNHKPTSEFATPRTENTQFTQGVRHAERANHKPTSELRATQVPGLTLPGLANCHSHAFHRALRGRVQRGRGTFWTWREQMYDVAGRIDPDTYFALARATYREMAAAGITSVGEFHYLHHQPDGTPYDDPLAMRHALRRGGRRGRHPDRRARHRLPLRRVRPAGRGRAAAVQRRRRGRPGGPSGPATGPAAIHSVRAVPREQLAERRAARRCTCTSPSSPPRTRSAWRPTASPRPGCSTTPASSGPPPPSCTPPTSPTTTPTSSPPKPRHHRVRHAHHRARPRRRHRPDALPGRGPLPAHRRQRQPRGHRPVRGAALPRGPRAAGLAVARPVDGGRAARRRHRPRDPRDRGRRGHRRRAARRPGHHRHREPPHGGHRGRRAHGGVRRDGGRRDPDRRRRPGRLPGRRRADRARARRGDRSPVGGAGEPAGHEHRRAGHERPAGRGPARDRDRRRRRARRRARGLGRPRADAPAADEVVDAAGRAVLPGFVDSHSHLVFAGDRAQEFAARMAGTPYAAGGIRTTVAATRAATDDELAANVGRLVAEMRRQGTTTVEIKSGYGLTVADEARGLAVARRFTEETTFLGAHVVPAEYADDPAGYVDLVTGPMLEAAAPHARWVDAFCETGAFDADQARAVLTAGAAAGLRGRLHANQLGPGPGVRLACELGLAAVDHCTYLDDADVEALADVRHGRHPAARRRVLDPPALPRRPPAARRRRRRRPGQRLQPGLLLHELDAALRRARRPGDGPDARRGRARRHRRRRPCPRPRRRRPPGRRRPRRPRAPRRAQPRAPRLPARGAARRPHLGRRAEGGGGGGS